MIKDQIQAIITAAVNKISTRSTVHIQSPDNPQFGDYTTNIAMRLAKELKKNPLQMAEEIAKQIPKDEIIEKVEVVKPGFINFWLTKETLSKNLIQILSNINNYGKSETTRGKKIIVEYSSPNIAKPFTIGHLRSTIIGDAIANLLEAAGWTVFRDNHLGDWGTQFGKQIYAIKTWGNIGKIEKMQQPVKELVRLYVKFHKEAEKNPEIEEQGKIWFKKLEDGNEEARILWQKCIDWSWKEFNEIYDKLQVTFTENDGKGYGESFFEDKMDFIIKELQNKKLLTKSKGAQIIAFPKDKYPPLMILKDDGATLYSTRDLATDKFRLTNSHYSADVLIINEVGAEQSLYFQQLFEAEKMLGWVKDNQRVHVKHGMYRFKDKKMSTRKGNVIWLEEVLEEAKKRAESLSKQHQTDATVSQSYHDNANIIGIGALKWNDLKRSANMDILFDWDEILNMQGNAGPYMQYTYVRCRSVISKSNFSPKNKLPRIDYQAEELELMRMLEKYPSIVESAAVNMAPNLLCNYLFTLAQQYNLFYQKHPILKADQDTKNFRLALTTAVAQVIKNGLYLLGIQTVEKM
ncbi:arginine--tRNA ligase [Candidatus Roizmanbacteria bacterium RIFCSPLOWO2_01_FULL_41_22]|uniref:Arginine--tRNA ligase n=3 Tax=Candidatus Roizmaniibacteriota TaxID=1752723 RepID=A0A1F7J8F0_9BACT|nr:MAG: arginine--tRNA ligase [Candidatus Roizmanbacteria bacterium RIFCSPLOWO2_01_FULL_41_22]